MKRLLAAALLTLGLCQIRPAVAASLLPACTSYLSAPGPIPPWIAPGQVLCLHSGDYPHAAPLALTTNNAVYQAAPGEHPRIVGVGITLYGHDLVLRGLTIDNGGTNGPSIPGVKMLGNHETLDQDEVANGHYNGIELRGAFDTLSASTVDNFDGVTGDAECVTVFKTASDVLIQGNHIHDCSGNGVELYTTDGIKDDQVVQRALIDSNTIERGTLARGETLIGIKDGQDITVTRNTLSGTQDYNWALGVRGWTTNVVFANNVLLGNYTGIEAGLFTNGGSPHNLLIANNIVDNRRALHGLNTESGGGFNIDLNGCYGCTLTHNTLIGANNYAIFVDGSLGWQGGSLSDNLIVGGVTPRLWPGSPLSGVVVSHNGWWSMASGFLSSPTDLLGTGWPFVSDSDYHVLTSSPALVLGAYPLAGVPTVTPTSLPTAPPTATVTSSPSPTPSATASPTDTASPTVTATPTLWVLSTQACTLLTYSDGSHQVVCPAP